MNHIIASAFDFYLTNYDCEKRLIFFNEHSDAFNKTLNSLEEALSDTEYYHGTGAYHYSYDGGKYFGNMNGVTFTLASLLTTGLVPQLDLFNEIFRTGVLQTLSLTKNHSYARCYADLFMAEGSEFEYAYGSSTFWGYFVAASMIIQEMSMENSRRKNIELKEERKDLEYEKKREIRRKYSHEMYKGWTRSFRKDGKYEDISFLRVLGAKSDIESNFGVIVGIKRGALTVLPNKYRGVSLYEVRTDKLIPTSSFSHIQVPLRNMQFTEDEINRLGVDIPVYPIEFVELIKHEQGFVETSKANPQI
jgi:hypothetical protein